MTYATGLPGMYYIQYIPGIHQYPFRQDKTADFIIADEGVPDSILSLMKGRVNPMTAGQSMKIYSKKNSFHAGRVRNYTGCCR